MDSWDDEVQENHVVIRYKDTDSILVKVTSETNVSQILKRACDKWNLNPEKHFLRYHTEELLESSRNIGASIPPNSTLHLVESEIDLEWDLEDDLVLVSLQIEGTVFKNHFKKTDTLTQVLNEIYEASSEHVVKIEENAKIGTSKKVNDKCKIKLDENEKLLILLPSGSVTLDQVEFDTTMLCDFNHGGHIFLTFMVEDLEDAPLLEDDQNDVLQGSQDENSQFFKHDRQETYPAESQPSVNKVKRQNENELSDRTNSIQTLAPNEEPLQESALFERFGLVYRLDDENSSSTDIVLKKTLEDKSGVFTQSWISICFQDNLALQASFSPLEYVQDIKTYVRKFIINQISDFQFTFKGTTLDEKDSIFSSGLAPSAKIHFIPKYTEDEEIERLAHPNSSIHLSNNGLDLKFTETVVSQSIAAATAINFSQAKPEITIKSEIYRPKSEESTWEKVKFANK